MITLAGTHFDLIDLTHQVSAAIPAWNGPSSFTLTTKLDYIDCHSEFKFRTHAFSLDAGTGTHMDAPAHCFQGGATIDALSLDTLCRPCIKIDISAISHERYSLSVADIRSWEEKHGNIEPGTFVVVCTGWSKHWHNPKLYHNNHLFPSVSKEAADLLRERGISGLGIGTLSPDRPEDGFVVHQSLLSTGIYLVENIAHADKMPEVGAHIFVVPLKIVDATESPIRLIGLIPHLS